MTVSDLFKERFSNHQKQLAKYAKVVFNDHFVLLLLVALGAGGLAYSEYVETVEEGAIIPRVILSIVLILFLSMGKMGTLLKEADKVFLLPKEREMAPVFRRALYRSLALFGFFIALLSAVSMPLLEATGVLSFNQWPYFFLHLLSLKAVDLLIQLDYFTVHKKIKGKPRNFLSFIVILSGVVLSIFGGGYYDLLFSFSLALGLWFNMRFIWSKERRFEWETMIETEEKRILQMYQFINLFTDVPQVSSHTKRLKFLDKWIAWQSKRKKNIYYYYFSRVFYRNTVYSGLVLRLTCMGSILLFLAPTPLMGSILSMVMLYMIGFQLIPLQHTVNNQIQFQLYPIKATGKIKAIQQFIIEVLGIISIIFTIIAFLHTWQNGLSIMIVNAVFIALFGFIYLPKRIKH